MKPAAGNSATPPGSPSSLIVDSSIRVDVLVLEKTSHPLQLARPQIFKAETMFLFVL